MGPVGARDDHVLAAVLAELLDVPRLVLEIELEEHRLLELGDDAGRRVDAGFLDDAFEEAGQIGKQIGVAADLHFDAGPLHLDHHLLAGRKPGAMHLGDGSGCERLGIDLGEQLAPGLLQPLLDEAQDLLEREGRRAVLQGRKLGDEIGRNHVRPRGEDLAELDEGRSQLGERVAKPARARRPKLRRRRTLGDLAPPERFPEARAVEQLAEAVLDDDLADLPQPLQVPDGLDHPRSLSQSASNRSIFRRKVSPCTEPAEAKADSSRPKSSPRAEGTKSFELWCA